MKIVSLQTHIVAVAPPHIGGMYLLFGKIKPTLGIEEGGDV